MNAYKTWYFELILFIAPFKKETRMAPRNKNIPTLLEKLQNFQKTKNLKARIAYAERFQNMKKSKFDAHVKSPFYMDLGI